MIRRFPFRRVGENTSKYRRQFPVNRFIKSYAFVLSFVFFGFVRVPIKPHTSIFGIYLCSSTILGCFICASFPQEGVIDILI